MTTVFNGAALVAHAGGATAVINASLVGLIEEAQRRSIRRPYGARFGVRGILREDFVDLASQTPETLEAVALTPASALGTSREPLIAAVDGRNHVRVSIVRESTTPCAITLGLVDLDMVALRERPFPVEWRHAAAEPISPLFRAWLDPLIGELPVHGELTGEYT